MSHMPAVHGKATDDELEYIEKELVEDGRFSSRSEAVTHLVRYTLHNKYGYDGE